MDHYDVLRYRDQAVALVPAKRAAIMTAMRDSPLLAALVAGDAEQYRRSALRILHIQMELDDADSGASSHNSMRDEISVSSDNDGDEEVEANEAADGEREEREWAADPANAQLG